MSQQISDNAFVKILATGCAEQLVDVIVKSITPGPQLTVTMAAYASAYLRRLAMLSNIEFARAVAADALGAPAVIERASPGSKGHLTIVTDEGHPK
jgi:hypothetical protein